jgi:uncharacterized protein YkwD
MRRFRTAALLASLLVSVLAVPTSASATSPELAMLQKVNAYRASHGVPQLHLSRSLAKSADSYSRHQMRSGYFGHASRIRASHRYRSLGEIIEIHRGLRPRVGLAFRNWVNSPPHRSVMLMSHFRYAGAGFVAGRFRGHRNTIWTMQFGKR